jgi:hypothetical protein
MFKVLNKDNAEAEYKIIGARSQNSNEDIASIVFGNYDDDTKITYRLGEIAVRDHYGNSDMNGYGNMIFRTNGTGNSNVQDRITIMHNGYIGIGTHNPQAHLHVNGNIVASNILYHHEPTIHTISPVTLSNSTVYIKAFAWIYPTNTRKISEIRFRSVVYDSSDIRVIDMTNNVTLGSMNLASNVNPVISSIYMSNTWNTWNSTGLELEMQARGHMTIDAITFLYN